MANHGPEKRSDDAFAHLVDALNCIATAKQQGVEPAEDSETLASVKALHAVLLRNLQDSELA